MISHKLSPLSLLVNASLLNQLIYELNESFSILSFLPSLLSLLVLELLSFQLLDVLFIS